MGLVLFYFSGTGNTRYIAHHLCDSLNAHGYNAKAVSIEGLNQIEANEMIDNNSVIGLAWPIYGSDIPANMQRFIKAMPVVENKPLLTFCTQMAFSGDGAVVMRRVLEGKGYIQRWAMQFKMPNNVIARGLPFKGRDDYEWFEVKYLKRARKLADYLAYKIIKNVQHIRGATIGHTILAMSQRPAFKYFGHGALAKLLGVNNKCTGCKLCTQMCPQRVIEMVEGKAVHKNTSDCIVCFRCSNFCPHDAITFLGGVKKPRYKGPDAQTHKAIVTNKKA